MSEYIRYNGRRIKDLRGQIFEDFRAVEVVEIKDKHAQWKCECKRCGNIEIISANHIARGKICKPCKELEKKRKKEERHGNKLFLEIGKQYERWTVIEPIKDKPENYYKCICKKCGTVREIQAKLINRGTKIYSCKCTKTENGVDPKNDLDLMNSSIFTHKNIKVLNKINGNGAHSVWNCKCLLCGKEWGIMQYSLLSGDINSCGCLNRENFSKNVGNYVGRAEGTSVSRIKSNKLNKNNTSGVTGVYYNKNKEKWFACIMFKRKNFYLGTFDFKEDAAKARKSAEKELYGNFLEWYAQKYPEQWKRLNKNKIIQDSNFDLAEQE
ncbi:MAG: AP2 domain-containing protein [Lachnospiraceae bacterium]|nr:AP2 domain-containing protein [Lachnospiraceae bacterium]